MFQGLELAGGQMRGPDKKQTLGNILGVAFAGAQRGARIKGDSMERLELGHHRTEVLKGPSSSSLHPLTLPVIT